ncbi:MAG: hypothetical protein PVG06_02160 [Desulfobacterales bacterium]|jgi:hypothetical protein
MVAAKYRSCPASIAGQMTNRSVAFEKNQLAAMVRSQNTPKSRKMFYIDSFLLNKQKHKEKIFTVLEAVISRREEGLTFANTASSNA